MLSKFDITTGQKVLFRLRDVHCPDQEQVLQRINSQLLLTGEVMLISDGSEHGTDFAVVQAEGVMCPLIVPVEDLKVISVEPANPGKATRFRSPDRQALKSE